MPSSKPLASAFSAPSESRDKPINKSSMMSYLAQGAESTPMSTAQSQCRSFSVAHGSHIAKVVPAQLIRVIETIIAVKSFTNDKTRCCRRNICCSTNHLCRKKGGITLMLKHP
jgi:hypothetical protein